MSIDDPDSSLALAKRSLRRLVLQRRGAVDDRSERSRQLWERLFTLPALEAAKTVMVYVHLPGEVETQPFFARLWQLGKRIVVPYCTARELGLFLLEDQAELTPQTLGILEPRPELRGRPEKAIQPTELDLVLTPGVAFDRSGGRLGYGKGYYDRLLARRREGAVALGLAFEAQLVDDVPMGPRDAYLDGVLTEAAAYQRPHSPKE